MYIDVAPYAHHTFEQLVSIHIEDIHAQGFPNRTKPNRTVQAILYHTYQESGQFSRGKQSGPLDHLKPDWAQS